MHLLPYKANLCTDLIDKKRALYFAVHLNHINKLNISLCNSVVGQLADMISNISEGYFSLESKETVSRTIVVPSGEQIKSLKSYTYPTIMHCGFRIKDLL